MEVPRSNKYVRFDLTESKMRTAMSGSASPDISVIVDAADSCDHQYTDVALLIDRCRHLSSPHANTAPMSEDPLMTILTVHGVTRSKDI